MIVFYVIFYLKAEVERTYFLSLKTEEIIMSKKGFADLAAMAMAWVMITGACWAWSAINKGHVIIKAENPVEVVANK